MDAVPGRRGAPRSICQYIKGCGDRGIAKTDRGGLFDIWWRRSGGPSFFPTPGNFVFGNT